MAPFVLGMDCLNNQKPHYQQINVTCWIIWDLLEAISERVSKV